MAAWDSVVIPYRLRETIARFNPAVPAQFRAQAMAEIAPRSLSAQR